MFWNKKKYTNGYSTVTVNGKTVRVRGNSISIINDQIIVDGNVTGNVNASGSVTCGDVGGDIDASGSVRCTRK